jgi:hypothetical protein
MSIQDSRGSSRENGASAILQREQVIANGNMNFQGAPNLSRRAKFNAA